MLQERNARKMYPVVFDSKSTTRKSQDGGWDDPEEIEVVRGSSRRSAPVKKLKRSLKHVVKQKLWVVTPKKYPEMYKSFYTENEAKEFLKGNSIAPKYRDVLRYNYITMPILEYFAWVVKEQNIVKCPDCGSYLTEPSLGSEGYMQCNNCGSEFRHPKGTTVISKQRLVKKPVKRCKK